MGTWNFLTNHARALVFIAHEPDSRLRDIAVALDVTERTAFGVMTDLIEVGYVAKEKEGRRNRYLVQAHIPIRDLVGRERAIGELVELVELFGNPKRPNGSDDDADLTRTAATFRRPHTESAG